MQIYRVAKIRKYFEAQTLRFIQQQEIEFTNNDIRAQLLGSSVKSNFGEIERLGKTLERDRIQIEKKNNECEKLKTRLSEQDQKLLEAHVLAARQEEVAKYVTVIDLYFI